MWKYELLNENFLPDRLKETSGRWTLNGVEKTGSSFKGYLIRINSDLFLNVPVEKAKPGKKNLSV